MTRTELIGRSACKTDQVLRPPPAFNSTFCVKFRAYDFSHLSIGDLVEARYGDAVDHSGIVVEALPSLGLFWLRETVTGARRIIDFDSFDIWYARTGA